MPDYLRHALRAGIKRLVATGQRHIPWDGIELPGLHKNGDDIPLEISFGASHREGKHFFTGIVRDISERNRADDRLRTSLKNEPEARPKAEEASRLKDEFLP
ncbi:MAG: PAS domain S-box protein, partial [Pyrinomonadaceae bacterium]